MDPNDITVIATDRSGNEGKATATPVWVPNRSIRIATATEQQEGNRIEVPIEINSKGDVGGMGFVLNYNHSYLMDPVLTWSSAAGGSINLVNEDVAGELRGTFSLGWNIIACRGTVDRHGKLSGKECSGELGNGNRIKGHLCI